MQESVCEGRAKACVSNRWRPFSLPVAVKTLEGLPQAFLRVDPSLRPQLKRHREIAANAAGQTLPADEGTTLRERREEMLREAALLIENQMQVQKQRQMKMLTIRGFAAEAEVAASVRLARLNHV
jgi:hypothetical protein